MTEKMGFETNRRIQREYRNIRVHAEIGDKEYHFRSKLEYRWAQHLELCKLGGLIKDWTYETHTFRFEKAGVKEYTPDFVIRNNDDTFEYHETKGHVAKFDIDKLKAVWDEYPDSKITLIFWRKPSKLSTQKRTKLETYCHRVIWNGAKLVKNEPIDMT